MHSKPISARHARATNYAGLAAPDSPAWLEQIDNPYLQGFFAPITEEVTANNLAVIEGEIPKDLFGAYFRNGPNQRFKPIGRHHWFDGDGMIYGLYFENGQAHYRNRWIRTPGFELEQQAGQSIWPGILNKFDRSLPLGPIKDTGNTDLVYFNQKLIALWYESGKPFSIDPNSLATLDDKGLSALLDIKVSAHAHVDEHRNELRFFSYGDQAPWMHYGVISADGAVHITPVELPGPRRPHDMGMTDNYCILHDFPIYYDQQLFEKTGKRLPLFHPETPTRFGIIPRLGRNADVQWFEFEPCYMLHVVNCYEQGDEIIMVGCRTDDPSLRPDPADGKLAAMISGLKVQANLYEWRMNRRTGQGTERKLAEENAEFPMINEQYRGRADSQFAYIQDMPNSTPALFDGIYKYQWQTGELLDHVRYGDGVFGSESPYAARQGATEEDDGYVLSIVVNTADWTSDCLIYNAKALSDGPVARLRLPHRVSCGFHTRWVPGERLPKS